MSRKNTRKIILGCFAILFLAAASASPAAAQRADSFVDIFRGGAGAGASADGQFKFARSKSSSNNGVQFGHGLAVGAGPNGIAVSNSIGAGAGPIGAAHNLNMTIGRDGTHLSQGGVVSQGGNRRVVSGGGTGIQNGQVYGGSGSSGFGNRTKAWSSSQTNQWSQPYVQGQPVYQGASSGQRTYTQSVSSQAQAQNQGSWNRSANRPWGRN